MQIKKIIFLFSSFLVFNVSAQKNKPTEKYADSLTDLGQYNEAISAYDQLLKSKPKDEGLLRGKAYAQLQKGDLKNAISEYKKIISLFPKCGKCFMNLAIAYDRKEKKDSALAEINKAIQTDPVNGEFYVRRAWINSDKIKDSLSVIEDFAKGIQLKPAAAEFYLLRARFNFARGKLGDASKDIQRAIVMDENYYEAHFLNYIVMNALGDNKAAITSLSKCYDINPDDPILISLKCLLMSSKGDTLGMRKEIESVAKKNDTIVFVQLYRALFYRVMKDYDNYCDGLTYTYSKLRTRQDSIAFRIYTQDASPLCSPSYIEFYLQRCADLFADSSKWNQAIGILSLGQKQFPKSCMLSFNKAFLFFNMKKIDECFVEIQKSLGNYNRTEIYQLMGLDRAKPEVAANAEKSFRFQQLFIFNECILNLLPKAKDKTGYMIMLSRSLDTSMVLLSGVKDLMVKKKFFNEAMYGNYLAQNEEKANMFLRAAESENAAAPQFYLFYTMILFKNACPGTFEENGNDANSLLKITLKAKKADKEKLTKALAEINTALKLDSSSPYCYYLRAMIKLNLGDKTSCDDLKKAYELQLSKTDFPPVGCKL